jgi:hypothetical protein
MIGNNESLDEDTRQSYEAVHKTGLAFIVC